MKVFFDGACEPFNPGGNMGWGVYMERDAGREVGSFHGFQAKAYQNSNNLAEYLAFHLALEKIKEIGDKTERVKMFGDSQLVVKQMRGEWQIKAGRYASTARICFDKLQELRDQNFMIEIEWIPRELNKKADQISKRQFKSRNINLHNYGKR